MTLPVPSTPLYNHPLPKIEQWLRDLGCKQDLENLHCWSIVRLRWKAQIILDRQEITVCYLAAAADGTDIRRSFKYGLSRQDVEDAIFSGP